MMRWRWPPLVSRKYEVRLIVRRLEGCDLLRECAEKEPSEVRKLTVEIRWKGPKLALSSLRRTAVTRNFTKEVEVDPATHNDVVHWDEEFQTLCNLAAYKDNVFHPWEIAFAVFNVSLSLSPSTHGFGFFFYECICLRFPERKKAIFVRMYRMFSNSYQNLSNSYNSWILTKIHVGQNEEFLSDNVLC